MVELPWLLLHRLVSSKRSIHRVRGVSQGSSWSPLQRDLLLKEGFWWQFRDHNESWEYQRFVDALMIPDEHFNDQDVNFTGLFPKPYPCPKASSCLGSLNSVRKPCKTGYGGPLCEVMITAYFQQLKKAIV